MDEKHIVSIDLGSDKIGLAVARIDGRNVEMMYYKETHSEGIVRGAVSNVKKATDSIREAVEEAQAAIGEKISFAVVNQPKYPIVQKNSITSLVRDGETCVEEGDIEVLRNNAVDNCELDEATEKVFEAVAQSYSDEEDFQISEEDIIGRTSERIEGNFHIYVGKKKNLAMVDKTLSDAGVNTYGIYFPGSIAAESVLTEDEKKSGVALVDMGAGATSVTVYKDGILRYYDSIPFGGQLVTKDIMEVCRMGESLAENIKKAYGVCLPDRLFTLNDKIIHVNSDKQNQGFELHVKFLSKIVTARMKEIINAVLYLIQESGYADNLNAGIVLTGGASQIGNCKILVKEMSGLSVRIGSPRILYTSEGFVDGITGPSAANALGLMLRAREEGVGNCTGALEKAKEAAAAEPAPSLGDIWNENFGEKQTVEPETPKAPESVKPAAKPAPKPEPRKQETKKEEKHQKGRFTSFMGNIFDALLEPEDEESNN